MPKINLANASSSSGLGGGCSSEMIRDKKIYAEAVYNQEVARWEKDKNSNKAGQWVNTVVEAGTIRDKVNGLVLMIQQSPFHRLATLDQLIALALSTTTRIAILAISSLKTLFFASYLPDTKLSFFAKHFDSLTKEQGERVEVQELVRWYYEDAIKARYATFIQALEKAAHSSLKEAKTAAIGTLQSLLLEKPEQEQTILSLLVDKMGDPSAKTANWTTNLILGVLQKHPNMKVVIVKEVQLFINKHSPLTTIVPLLLLSHIVLARDDGELANTLVSTYFRQLKILTEQKKLKRASKKDKKEKEKNQKKEKKKSKKEKVKEPEKEEEAESEETVGKESVDTKMVSVLLTGVNRAFPYAKLPQDVYESHLDILFSLVEHGGFNRKVQGLAVIFKVIRQQQQVSETLDTTNRSRFYHMLYDLLLATELGSGFGQPNYKQAFFALVQGAIDLDKDTLRARAFVKRLLAMSAHARPGFACSALLLASRLFEAQPILHSMVASTIHPPAPPKAVKPDPLFHNEGNNSCLWELCALRSHSHPLVAQWAQLLSTNAPISYTGNPLNDLSHSLFLARFQNKQPSTKERTKGKVKVMQPRQQVTHTTFSFTLRDFQTKKESEIRPDEMFFYKYLQNKLAMLEREDQPSGGAHKHKKRENSVSAEALEGLLQAEAEDGEFGLDGNGLYGEDEEDGSNDESEEPFEAQGKRGEKRKGAPQKKEEGSQKGKKHKGGKAQANGKKVGGGKARKASNKNNKNSKSKKGPQKKPRTQQNAKRRKTK